MRFVAMLACGSTLALMVAQAHAQAVPPAGAPEEQASGEAAEGAPGQSQTDALAPQDEAPRAAASSTDGDLIVTGSRVVSNGYQAPTPITVVGTEELRNTAPTIADALRQLPQLTGSTGPATPSFTPSGSVSSTSSTANLRNLGITRTLVLLDGRRPPVSGVTGTSDISTFPQQLIKRVDIVTGGASAAYGSDAVAGVVNFVLDTRFRGVMAEARNGISSEGDGHAYGLEVSAGFGFDDDRGSLIVSGNVTGQDLVDGFQRDWGFDGFGTIPNPRFGQPGEPQLLLRAPTNLGSATYGGLIPTGPLRDTQFDASGNPIPYVRGTLYNGTVEVGGSGPRYPAAIVSDVKAHNFFAHAEYELASGLSVFAEGMYGYSDTSYPLLAPFTLGANAYQIRIDNAFLPAATREAMRAAGLSVIPVAKVDRNFGQNIVNNITKTFGVTTGFKAELGGFTIDGYYEHGETRYSLISTNQRVTANAKLAADAVVNPATGQIVCRSTLTNPTNGCVPFSVFGEQPLTPEQRAYQQGSGFARSLATQDVVALTVRGSLFDTWAGPVAAAVGAEYRDYTGTIEVDPISRVVGFSATNPQPSTPGAYDVKEAFGEVLVPLFKGDGAFRSLDFNGAIRRTDYSNSGGVTTWKLGLTGEVLPGLRLRGTYSRDIRAPNLGDLFGPRTRNIATVVDPFNNNVLVNNVFTFAGSNPNLVPERATTIAAGATFRPEFVPGLGFSVDYYNIKINQAISTLTFQQIINQCFAGQTDLCSLITRDANGVITNVDGFGLNIATVKISGVDVDASYRFDLGGGALNLRAIGTYLGDYTSIAPGIVPIQQAGTASFPKWRANLQATFTSGDTTVSVQERFIGAHRRVTPPTTIDDDHVPAVFYTNLTLRQQFKAGEATPELFLSVNNLFDRDPPPSGVPTVSLGTLRSIDPPLYDTVGRYCTSGGRIRF